MEIPYEVKPRRDTGLFNAKLGIWLFLASEVMLFGGLFSAYVFLRVGVDPGVDNPWPWGVNVQNVTLGFVNTLVLIISSVLVVFAWVSVKERKWGRYQVYMYSVVACAVIFMGIKAYEYNLKLNHHYGVKLKDNTVMEGVLVGDSDLIHFEGKKISLSKSGSVPAFLRDLDGENFPEFTVEGSSEKITLSSKAEVKKWFLRAHRELLRATADERRRYRAEIVAFDKAEAKEKGSGTKPVSVAEGLQKRGIQATAVLVAKPFKVSGNPRKIVMHSEKSLSYRDGASIEGRLIDDTVKFAVHSVDMQLVLPINQRSSMAWDLIGEEGKKQFFEAQKVQYDGLIKYYKGKPIPEKMLRGYILNLHDIHTADHHGEKSADHAAETSVSRDEKSDHKDDSHEGAISIPRDQIKFMGSHGPRYGNYYAIYFTMTALHGLHVIGGALVLLFFAVFGKKLYLKDPEHLANRVEVGGLFWHFVDLIWIFLFPLMYLL